MHASAFVELAQHARRLNPNAVVVFGGPEPTCAPMRSLEAGADYVIRGEAELTLPRFVEVVSTLEHPASRQALLEVPGIMWREEGELLDGPDPVQLTREQVNSLPLIDTSLVHGYEAATTGSVWR